MTETAARPRPADQRDGVDDQASTERHGLQPFLAAETVVLRAPAQAWSAASSWRSPRWAC